jgi:hypothetical protein
MMGPKSARDIQGLEYDWLATDGDDRVALFSTAGGGYAPPAFLHDTDAHDAAIAALLALPASTSARFAPELEPGLENTWRLVAERGLYAYDADPAGGPYRLVAAPTTAARSSELPAAVAELVRTTAYSRIRFAELDTISDEILEP